MMMILLFCLSSYRSIRMVRMKQCSYVCLRRSSTSIYDSKAKNDDDHGSNKKKIDDCPSSLFLDGSNRMMNVESLKGKEGIVASRLGLDPTSNRFHQPIVYHENYSFANWPESHTFPMDKFARLAHALQTTSKKTEPNKSTLSRPIVRQASHFFRPLDVHHIPRAWIAQPTGPIDGTFLDSFLTGTLTNEEARYIGFREQTSRPELVERTILEVAGTILACQLAYNYGIATNAAGGTHHAHPKGGAGYTILNDLAIATNFLTSPTLNGFTINGIHRVLVIDCDVHQGDGTAKFSHLLQHKLFTLSLHCASNYPRLKAHSTFDVGLPDGMEDDEYMNALVDNVNHAMDVVNPDFVLYDAGVDIYEKDKLGRLNITESGIRRRDRWVLERCISADIPVAAVIGGGYDKDVDALARRHAIVHEEAAYLWRKYKLWKQSKS